MRHVDPEEIHLNSDKEQDKFKTRARSPLRPKKRTHITI